MGLVSIGIVVVVLIVGWLSMLALLRKLGPERVGFFWSGKLSSPSSKRTGEKSRRDERNMEHNNNNYNNNEPRDVDDDDDDDDDDSIAAILMEYDHDYASTASPR